MTKCHKRRICYVQELTNIFWKKWTTFYFASLIVRKKWHHEQRDVAMHDIVIIHEKDLPRGQWKIGEIAKTFHGIDNKVRHVTVRYKSPNSSSYTEVERPIQKLDVLLPVEERLDMS